MINMLAVILSITRDQEVIDSLSIFSAMNSSNDLKLKSILRLFLMIFNNIRTYGR